MINGMMYLILIVSSLLKRQRTVMRDASGQLIRTKMGNTLKKSLEITYVLKMYHT